MQKIKNFFSENKTEIVAGVTVGVIMFGAIQFFNKLPKP